MEWVKGVVENGRDGEESKESERVSAVTEREKNRAVNWADTSKMVINSTPIAAAAESETVQDNLNLS